MVVKMARWMVGWAERKAAKTLKRLLRDRLLGKYPVAFLGPRIVQFSPAPGMRARRDPWEAVFVRPPLPGLTALKRLDGGNAIRKSLCSKKGASTDPPIGTMRSSASCVGPCAPVLRISQPMGWEWMNGQTGRPRRQRHRVHATPPGGCVRGHPCSPCSPISTCSVHHEKTKGGHHDDAVAGLLRAFSRPVCRPACFQLVRADSGTEEVCIR